MDLRGSRSTTGTLRLCHKSSAARHIHSLSHVLTRSHTHVDNRTCNVNLAAEESRTVITERWRGSHNHKDSNRNLNQQMIPDQLVPSVYSRPFRFTLGTEKPIVPCTNVNVSLIEHLSSLWVVLCNCAFLFLAFPEMPHQLCLSWYTLPADRTGSLILSIERHTDFDRTCCASYCCVHQPTTDALVCFSYTHKHCISTVSAQMAETVKWAETMTPPWYEKQMQSTVLSI